ncbi:MAG: C10 family peptidase [Prevotella sp.]
MKKIVLSLMTLSGMLPALAGSIPDFDWMKSGKTVYSLQLHPSYNRVEVRNLDGGGFVIKAGENLVGYNDKHHFDPATAAPALIEWMHALAAQPTTTTSGKASVEKAFSTTAVFPLLGEISWNQDAPFNNDCPQYELGKTSPTGCVATAMAQVMYYHQWPKQGEGSHSYAPAILSGNTLSANFGETTYRWDAMLPHYTATSSDESCDAVAELMLHCGVAVDMVYYSQSGASDTIVPKALSSYFRYDHSMAYRKREHYPTNEWLRIIHDELAAGRPVLAYGKSSSGGHAYVFDGMDENGLIHVNWGWGGMSNGYFNTSALTPASQGIGGSDGGFNYSQRIITGIRPRIEGEHNDDAVELASTEGLTTSKSKISQGGEVTVKLSGKVKNHGWQKSTFDYGVELVDDQGNSIALFEGPKTQTLDMEESAYGPSFGSISLGHLTPGSYTLRPVCRASGGTGAWQPVRDHYIGYPNILRVTATESQILFEAPDYFCLEASGTELPETIYSGVPTLITTQVKNTGDVEYHGEIKVQLRNAQNSIVATTKNYIIDLQPDEETSIRFTDAYQVEAGEYTLCIVDDDGTLISARQTVNVKETAEMGTPYSTEALRIVKADRHAFTAEAKISVNNGLCGGLFYTYIYTTDNKMAGCLFPEYVLVENGQTATVVMQGSFENAVEGATYRARLAFNNDGSNIFFLNDELSSIYFTFGTADGIREVQQEKTAEQPSFRLSGQRTGSDARGLIIRNGKLMINK